MTPSNINDEYLAKTIPEPLASVERDVVDITQNAGSYMPDLQKSEYSVARVDRKLRVE